MGRLALEISAAQGKKRAKKRFQGLHFFFLAFFFSILRRRRRTVLPELSELAPLSVFFSSIPRQMERSTLSASPGAQSAGRGLLFRQGATAARRRSFGVVDSLPRSSSPPLVAVGLRLNFNWQQQSSRILQVRAAPSSPPPPGSAGDEADVLKLHEELLAQVSIESYFNRKSSLPIESETIESLLGHEGRKKKKTPTSSHFGSPSFC